MRDFTPAPTGKSLLKEPPVFDGNKDAFKEWQRKLFAYIRDPRNRITTDDERIDIALSYIEGPKVQDWIQNLYDSYYDKNWE